MNIFNSLGSNYNLKYVFRSLFSDTTNQNQRLKSLLTEKYQGKTILTYKGREALTLALKIPDLPKESSIAINGFTCVAVYKAIEQAGLTPVCLDLEKNNTDLNFSMETLKKTLNENKNIKAVVIQNTLGYPTDIEKIVKICKENNIILIEDLAHCVGTKYTNGKEAGMMGDIVILSFSQDKIIDAVSGGALVIRNKEYQNKTLTLDLAGRVRKTYEVGFKQQLKDHLYPLLTYKIRSLYNLGLGKPLHFLFKKINLLSQPMNENFYDFYSLPDWYCNLAVVEFGKLNQQLDHRKEIAKIYKEKLNKEILNVNITEKISLSSNLRFPIFVENRNSLIKFLKKSKIFVSDIWYDDVAPECPNAVMISKKILNLPTHINVTKKDALKISERINLWQKSQ